MGFKTEFNWVLKLKPEQGLDEEGLERGEIYNFEKDEYRVYPAAIPIDLVNREWEAVAKVVVLEFRNCNGKTCGRYKVLRKYEGEEKHILTNYWKETIEFSRK